MKTTPVFCLGLLLIFGTMLAAQTPGSGATSEGDLLQGVLPSSQLVTTDLGVLSIGRPNNWQVVPSSKYGWDVMIAPQAGVTRDGIGYGVAVNGVPPSEVRDIDAATMMLMRSIENSNSHMRALGRPQPISVAGVKGRSVMMQSTSQFRDDRGQPQKETDWLVTIPRHDGSVLYLLFVAPKLQFDRFRPTYESMLNSIRF